eukprot:6578862-Prymnesium_polylepis.1
MPLPPHSLHMLRHLPCCVYGGDDSLPSVELSWNQSWWGQSMPNVAGATMLPDLLPAAPVASVTSTAAAFVLISQPQFVRAAVPVEEMHDQWPLTC